MLLARSPPRGADPHLLSRLIRLIASAAIPGGGYLLGQWTPATALVLYWFENFVGGFAMAIRIAEHHRLTGDGNHRHPQIGFTMTMATGNKEAKPVKFRSFFAEFLTGSTVFNVAHGIFLGVVLAAFTDKPDPTALQEGAITIALCHAISVTIDLFAIQNWPFAKLKGQAENLMGRTILVQFALIGGTWWMVYRNSQESFFRLFVWLKAASDVAGMLPSMSSAPVIALDQPVERDTDHNKKKKKR